MRHRSLPVIAAVALVLGCDANSRPLAPSSGERPTFDIYDGSLGGNPDFFFLPPVLPSPTAHEDYDAGKFNGGWRPVVEICELTGANGSCTSAVKTFSGSDIAVSSIDESYKVNWDTRAMSPALNTSSYYRVSVKVADQILGSFDVDPVTSASVKNAQTGQHITLVDGRTLPIKFRIEQGALANAGSGGDFAEVVVTNAGGDVVTSTGFAAAHFPEGWLPAGFSEVVVTIARVPVGTNNDCHQAPGLLQFEGCYQFETYPDVGTFAQDVRVEVCTELPTTDPRFDAQALFKSDVDEPLTEIPGANATLINCAGFAGTGPVITLDRVPDRLWQLAAAVGRVLAPKPAYAIDLGRGGTVKAFSRFGWGIPLEIAIDGGDGQTAPPGSVLDVPLSVLVTGTHLDGGVTTASSSVPISGVPVAFSVATGGGSVSAPSVQTSGGGASVNWTLGTATGTQTVTASITTVAHAPGVETLPRTYTPVTKSVTFTANAALPATLLVGTVTSGASGIPGATVTATNPSFGTWSATSDASGAYAINVPSTYYGQQVTLTSSALGYNASTPVTVTLSGGTITQNITLTVP